MKLLRIYMPILLVLLILFSGCQSSHSKDAFADSPSEHTSQAIPSMYTEVLNDYQKIINYRLSASFEEEYTNGHFVELSGEWAADLWVTDNSAEQANSISYKWHCMLVDMLDYIDDPNISSFGYILTDLDGDGIDELLWVSSDHTIFAVFTASDGQAKLVDAYFPKYKCIILDSGELYTQSTGSAGVHEYTIERIDHDADDLLRTVRRFGRENNTYYEESNGDHHTISQEMFEEILIKYPFTVSDKWKANIIHPLGT